MQRVLRRALPPCRLGAAAVSSAAAGPAAGVQRGSVAIGRRVRRFGTTASYLKVLGLQASCSDKELKAAYRKRVIKWHPDVYMYASQEMTVTAEKAMAAEQFRLTTEAYEALILERDDDSSGGGWKWGQSGPQKSSTSGSQQQAQSQSAQARTQQHSSTSFKEAFWQRPGDTRTARAEKQTAWKSEMADFFAGVRDTQNTTKKSRGWSHGKHTAGKQQSSQRSSEGHRSTRDSGAEKWRAKFSERYNAEGLNDRYGVGWAERWSGIFTPPKDSDVPFTAAGSAATGPDSGSGKQQGQWQQDRSRPTTQQRTERYQQQEQRRYQPSTTHEKILRNAREVMSVVRTAAESGDTNGIETALQALTELQKAEAKAGQSGAGTGAVHVDAPCTTSGSTRTALHLAAGSGHQNAPAIVRVLLNHGADPNAVDSRGNTPLLLCVPTPGNDFVINRSSITCELGYACMTN